MQLLPFFFLFIIIIITMVYIYRNASKCYVAEFTKSVRTFEMHEYIFISIICWKNKQQCNQLQYEQQCPTSFNMKNHSAEQKSCNKKGSRAKKSCCKKITSKFRTKNAPCVNRTIEIALERMQRDISANSRRQNRGKFALCVSRH